MQHPDEGLIHTWLDGQLPEAEAAQLESHIAECPECAAKVAEARGFAAGASRILTALDDAPRGVIPVAPRAQRRIPFLKAAAVLLIVATGGTIVLRSRESTSPPVVASATRPAAPSVAPINQSAPVASAPISNPPAVANIPRAVARQPAATTSVESGNNTIAVAAAPPRPPAAVALGHDTSIAIVMTPERATLTAAVTTGVVSVNPTPALKLVNEEPFGRGKLRTYEVAPGKVVRLIEAESAVADKSVSAAASTVALRGAYSARGTVSSTAQSLSMEVDPATFHTIRWTDKTTGKAMTLMGPFTETELQQIRQRIETDLSRSK